MAQPTNPQNRRPAHPREAAEKIVRVLQEAGHVAYFAGGCVRDMLRGRPEEATDYDVATDAEPKRVAELFHRAREVGEAFGVMLVRLKGCEVEVATFRREWGYADGRHPDHVEYCDADHDARRRDFTINGMFYDPVADEMHDFVGGRDDLERGVIRAIGEASERFGEDYLRMLRAVRFAARFDFAIEQQTREAIVEHASKLSRISRERIGAEVRMMMVRPARAAAAELLQALGLDGPTLGGDHMNAELQCLATLPASATYAASLAAWMLDRLLGPAPYATVTELADAIARIKVVQHVRAWRKALVLSNDVRAALVALLNELPIVLRWGGLGIAERKRMMARAHWPELVDLLYAALRRNESKDFDLCAFEQDTAVLAAEGVAPEPLIDGNDLIALGLLPGPAFKHVLDEVYDAQLAGQLTTRDEALAMARAVHSKQ